MAFNFSPGINVNLDSQGPHLNKLQKHAIVHPLQYLVEDARRSGVHPLAALGAQTYQPTVMPSGGSSFSASVDRIDSESRALSNDLIKAQTEYYRKLGDAAIANATMGSISAVDSNRNLSQPGYGVLKKFGAEVPGARVFRYGPQSSSQDIEDRYGDLAQEFYGAWSLMHDFLLNLQSGVQESTVRAATKHKTRRGRR